jgi:aminoglycoside phosphotransferase (APT) family kinase protein
VPGSAEITGVTWLPECSPAAVTEALRAVAPELSGLPVTLPDQAGPDPASEEDPLYQSSSAALGDEFVVKFAWSRPAARRVRHQISVLRALAEEPAVPFLPEVVVASTDPLLLVTRRVPGTSLFEVVDSIDRDHAAEQLARFLAALHSDEARQRVADAVGTVPAWYPLVTTNALRERFGAWVSSDQQRAVERWCDWADEILSGPGQMVLVHGDLHGDNQVWDGGELRAVLDFENAGVAEPEYELRAFPGPVMGPDGELLSATMRHYERLTGRGLSGRRVLAWHVRHTLSDALWRSEAGLPLPDHRSPGAWVDDLAVRSRWFGIQVLCHGQV